MIKQMETFYWPFTTRMANIVQPLYLHNLLHQCFSKKLFPNNVQVGSFRASSVGQQITSW